MGGQRWLVGRVGARSQYLYLAAVAAGAFNVEWGQGSDLERAGELNERCRPPGPIGGWGAASFSRLFFKKIVANPRAAGVEYE